jgi:hypothetical protein
MKAGTKAAIVALLLVSACAEWVHFETPQEALMRARGGAIQVTKTDRSVLRINHAAIVGDSLVGMVDHEAFLRGTLLRDVASLDIQQFSPCRTTLLVVGGIMAAFISVGILIATAPPWQF